MKVAVLLSGGVDSSVALHLLRDQGYDLYAFYLKIWLAQDFAHLGDCPWEEDLQYATQVCDQLNVELSIIDLQQEYWQHVIATSVSILKQGGTPSPDVLCNQHIKFDFFLRKIAPKKFDKIASGHYAQILEKDGFYFLLQGADVVKDQSYFLSRLSQLQLKQCLFPIGHLQKSQVRAIAVQKNLPNHDRKDSQGLCFLGKIKFSEFVKLHLGENPGPIQTVHNLTVGQHKGLWYHTIGQRQQLGLSGGPWYVVEKKIDSNTLVICHQNELEKFSVLQIVLQNLWWIPYPPKQWEDQPFAFKLRHGPTKILGTISPFQNRHLIRIQQPDSGVASDQIAVIYRDEYCLGSGSMVVCRS